jgi:response regulator RpfG family c-di-GMP phosphodiesterase
VDAPDATLVLPALLAAAVNYTVTAGLVAWAVALSTNGHLIAVWREKYLWLLPHYLVLGVFGFIIAIGYSELGVLGLLVMTSPPLLIRYGMKQYVERTAGTVSALKEANSELREANVQVSAMSNELQEGYQETLHALVSALDVRDSEVHGHSIRVVDLALQIGQHLGVVPESQTWRDLKQGALLHDVGKIGVPDYILRKPAALSPEEWDVMREHPVKGYAMLQQVRFLRGAAQVALCHHERFDGSGYPRGLARHEIPLIARIFAVADAFDAMTAPRPYRDPLTPDKARLEIEGCASSQFDPDVVQAFLALTAATWPQPVRKAA